MKFPTNADTGQYLDQAAAAAWAKSNGVDGQPAPPRNLQAQPGSRNVLVTWDAPEVATGIVGYKIYTANEGQLLDTLNDPNVRQYTVPASSGSTPPGVNIFVSSITKRSESTKTQIQGTAKTEAGAPTNASPPPGSAASGQTGNNLPLDNGPINIGGRAGPL